MAVRKRKWMYRKNGRFYGDFRTFADVGGSQEALVPQGERFATKKHPVAKRLAKARLAELKRLRKAGLGDEWGDLRRLGPFVDYHLEKEARRRRSLPNLRQIEQRLHAAIQFFGEDALLREIDTAQLQDYVDDLRERVRWEGTDRATTEPIDPGTQLKYLAALSKLFRRARSIKILPSEHQPFQDIMDLPDAEAREAEWLDGPTAALVLEAARLYRPKRADIALPCAHTMVATLLLTGMRASEGLGLRIEDIDFERKVIRVRWNRHRRLKTKRSRRVVPLWPQLETILRAYLERRGSPTEGILFPSPTKPGQPVRGIKRLVAELAIRIDYDGTLTPKVFRHTYCAARLQTLDQGAPVARSLVAREMGHSRKTMDEVYTHVDVGLSSFPRRPWVEISVADHALALEGRLMELQGRTEQRNSFRPALANRVPLETELAVLEYARTSPQTGPRKVARALTAGGHEVSPSGVRWIWFRYDLHRTEFRLHAIATGRFDQIVKEVRALREG
jgi:integrase